jgi:hypothetical protein
VLFWTFEPGHIDDGWGVQQTHPMAGVAGGSTQAGGTVIEEPSQQPYGKSTTRARVSTSASSNCDLWSRTGAQRRWRSTNR